MTATWSAAGTQHLQRGGTERVVRRLCVWCIHDVVHENEASGYCLRYNRYTSSGKFILSIASFVLCFFLVVPAASTSCGGVPTPAPFTSLGGRVLDYLHGGGEALSWVSPWPWKVIYIDTKGLNYNNPPSTIMAAVDAGATVIVLSFYTALYGPVDMAAAWAGADPSARAAAVAYAHSAGAVVLVSAGGASDVPYGIDATAFGASAATFAVTYGLDGLDMDLENVGPALSYGSVDVIAWISAASISARAVLCPMRLLTHAPQAPYFGAVGDSGPNPWTGTSGGYTAIWDNTGPTIIDAFLVQFYNQGSSCYTTQTGLFSASVVDCSSFPGTSLLEIASYGIPVSRIVIGKIVLGSDGSNGWVDAHQLSTWFAAISSIWSAGIMLWQWDATAAAPYLTAVVPGPSWSATKTPASATSSGTPSHTPSETPTPASASIAATPLRATPSISASPVPCGPIGGGQTTICAIGTAEAATRATLTAIGQTPSACTASYQQCANGALFPLQNVAPGTACLGGAFVLQSSAACTLGVWAGPGTEGSFSATPSVGANSPSATRSAAQTAAATSPHGTSSHTASRSARPSDTSSSSATATQESVTASPSATRSPCEYWLSPCASTRGASGTLPIMC